MEFNPNPPTVMHIDLNSCFATIEQQANPYLRGKPIAVAAYTTANGCILAPSVEAKRCGVKTGMRVKEGKTLCPSLVVLASDPWKYRNVHLALRQLLSEYTADLVPKSIDEFVLNLEGYPCLTPSTVGESLCNTPEVTGPAPRGWEGSNSRSEIGMKMVALDIKRRIKKEIGEWLTVSIGVAPNRYLAKVASSLHKPDGLDEINRKNFFKVYSRLKLTDLPYIKLRNAIRLNSMGIYTVVDFYNSPLWKLKAAFESINAYYWYLRLRGWEIDGVEFGRRSYGNSYALAKPLITIDELSPILAKLVTKTATRLRKAGYKTRGVHVSVVYRDGTYWHKGMTLEKEIFDTRDIYKKALTLLSMSPYRKPVRELAESCFNLIKSQKTQLELFEDIPKKEILTNSIDKINEHWGDFVIIPARVLKAYNTVPDRIAFGGVKELEEFTLTQY